MSTFTGSSRLANFRQKKNSAIHEGSSDGGNFNSTQNDLKLTLPQQEVTSAYEPTATFNNTRTSMRLFKGKIDRGQSSEKQGELRSSSTLENAMSTTQKLSLGGTQQNFKLILNDSPQIIQKKTVTEVPLKPLQKRIMITKDQQKQQSVKQVISQPLPKKESPVKTQKQQPNQKSIPEPHQIINPHDQKPIKEQDVQESRQFPVENENDLVICPEGCGRKFNRKALQKHAKACKIVFMSKRKQFNSEAKRLSSKQQANLIKQNKLKQKSAQFAKSKTKGFEKTGDNWKAASEDFRSAIKGIKKDENQQEAQNDDILRENEDQETNLNLVQCEFCEKKFAQILIQKHVENCVKRKEKLQKKGSVAKKK